MKILGVIPARYASTRFPGKPLALIDGVPMICRVYTQAKKCLDLAEVVVATDDERIAQTVMEIGGKVVMTAAHHASGTDRCAEVATLISGYDVIINIQGDEPYIDPMQISQVAACFRIATCQIATLVKRIDSADELHNPNRPKVVTSSDGKALYFSRQPIPFLKGADPEAWHQKIDYFKHIGIYGYRAQVLAEIAALPPGKLEQAESLEQLRWIEAGYTIHTAITRIESKSVDLPEDIAGLHS